MKNIKKWKRYFINKYNNPLEFIYYTGKCKNMVFYVYCKN